MKVAAVQYCASVDWQTNRSLLDAQLSTIDRTDLLLLPENFAGYGGDYRQLAEQQTEIMRWLSGWAAKLNTWIVAGSLPQIQRPNGQSVVAPRVRASQLVIAPDGRCQARYDKLHLFDVNVGDRQGQYRESAVFEAGDTLVLTSIADWSVGLGICYDLRFPMQALHLAHAGADLLLYPSAFTQATGEAHWQVLLQARAVETGCYVLAANLCGQHNAKRQSYGHSMLVDPWGQVVTALDAEPGVLIAELDAQLPAATRQRLPLQSHQRLHTRLPDDIRFEKQF